MRTPEDEDLMVQRSMPKRKNNQKGKTTTVTKEPT